MNLETYNKGDSNKENTPCNLKTGNCPKTDYNKRDFSNIKITPLNKDIVKTMVEEANREPLINHFQRNLTRVFEKDEDSIESTFIENHNQCNYNNNEEILPLNRTPLKDLENCMFTSPQFNGKRMQSQCNFALPKHKNPFIHEKIRDIEDTPNKITVNSTEFMVLKSLGKGGSAQVYSCYNANTQQLRAIKCIKLDNQDNTLYFKEIDILKKLKICDKVAKMFDFELCSCKHLAYIVLEHGGPDLGKVLKEFVRKSIYLPLYKLNFYWIEILNAVKQIHSHRIIHSDLKPANFLLMDCSLKLIDFGISSCLGNDENSVIKTNIIGSVHYISPEAVFNCNMKNKDNVDDDKTPKYKITFKSDIWSIGCILYQMVYNFPPFQHFENVIQKFSEITNPNHKINYPQRNDIHPNIISTIKKCLQYDVSKRPTIIELIEDFNNFTMR